jgi:protein-L-isoaspartate(D-aspartate) O-methyltransferase
MTEPLAEARRCYADELKFTTAMRSGALHRAFATVPRERFLGAGPWRIKSPWNIAQYWTTDNADPRAVYHDVLIALDEKLGLNNGQPALWAFLFDRLGVTPGASVAHLGCGTGYYTAILAELVGPTGTVTAIEVHPEIAEKARSALAPWPQVAVAHADGSAEALEPSDILVASAGATHPLPIWLDALKPGGRLVFPMTASNGPGGMLLVTRRAERAFAAKFLCNAAFYEFSGARDPEVDKRLRDAFAEGRSREVQSLRSDPHDVEKTCWLHGEGWCLSLREPAVARQSET